MAAAQIEKTIDSILDEKQTYINKEASLIQQEMNKVESHLKLIREQAQYQLTQPYGKEMAHIAWTTGAQGYIWEHLPPDTDRSNAFISAISADNRSVQSDLAQLKQLEPLLKQTTRNDLAIKGVFISLSESGWIIYPPLNADYEVSIGKLPPSIRVQDYTFYSAADPEHNPKRQVVWTLPYQDVTHWNEVITAVAPIYLPDGQFRGVVGADVPLDHFKKLLEDFKFPEPNGFAFITDRNGSFITGNQEKLAAFYQIADITKPYPYSLLIQQGMLTISTSQGDYYMVSAPVPSNQWMFNFVFPKSDIIQPIILDAKEQTSKEVTLFYQRLILFILVGSCFLILLSYRFSKTVTEPVNRLTEGLNASTLGNYQKQIPVTQEDEIGTLTESFNRMNRTIQQLFEELNDRAIQQEVTVQERTQELQEAHRRLQDTYNQLSKSEQARTELIVQISHDLKTPLTSIRGFLEVMKGKPMQEQEQNSYIDLILRRTNHTIQLIHDLFDITAVDGKSKPLDKEWISLDFLIRHSLDMVITAQGRMDLQVELEIEDEDLLIWADPRKLNRVFVNMIDNAMKYSKGDHSAKLRIQAYTQHDHCIVEFIDNGMGISAEALPHIFTPYYRDQAVKARRVEGSGLGLAIAMKVIEGHGGKIHVHSVPGIGTTFRIELPIGEDQLCVG